jgi:hypothetical protein
LSSAQRAASRRPKDSTNRAGQAPVSLNSVSPDYFATSGTPLLAGRNFRDAHSEGPRRVIVNQPLARRYFAGRDPIALHVWLESERDPYEIVGVAGDAKYVVALLVVAALATFMPAPAPRTSNPSWLSGRNRLDTAGLRSAP